MSRLLPTLKLVLGVLLLSPGCSGPGTPSANDPSSAAPQGPIRQPPLAAPRDLTLPEISKSRLKNGLRIWVLPDHSLPLVSVNLHLEAGVLDAPLDRMGLATFTAMMLRQGVEGMDADTLSETVDMAGASLSANAHGERTIISCWARKEHTELCLKLVAQLATKPTFPGDEMKEVRDKLLGQVKQLRDDPGSMAAMHFGNQLYGDNHPEGAAMSAATLARITRADLLAFHKKLFVPGAALLGVSGDMDPATAKTLAGKYFGPWIKGDRPPRKIPPVADPPPGLRVLLVDKPDLTQASFTLGHAGLPRVHKDREVVEVLNHVLGGGGFSSRLMKKVRSEGGKTYGVSSSFSMYHSFGDFTVSSFTRTAELIATMELVRQELAGIQTRPPTAQESAAARGKLAGGYPLRMQTASTLLHYLISSELDGLGEARVTGYPSRIHGITLAQLKEAAAAHLRPGNLLAVVVGKAAELAPALDKAKIRFTQVSYLDPISAAERATRAAEQAKPRVTAEELKAARKLLATLLRKAGGRKRLAGIRTLRLEGEAKLGPVSGAYVALALPPDHLRMELRFQGMTMVQVLAGNKGFAAMGPRRQNLPPDRLKQVRQAMFSLPALLPLRALDKDVQARQVNHPRLGLKKGQVAVEIFPPGLASQILVFSGGRLLQIRRLGDDLAEQVTELSEHRKVSGVLIPHQSTTSHAKGGAQSVTLKRVLINSKVTPEMITGESAGASKTVGGGG